jgi:hypothetical protein
MACKKMSLREFINKFTVKRLSEELTLDSSTIRYWRTGRSLPRVWDMKAIVVLSNGAVTYEEMIETFLASGKGNKQ